MTKKFESKYMYSPYTQESFSATKGNYFSVPDNFKFTDSKGNDLQLIGVMGIGVGGVNKVKVLKQHVRRKDL